MNKKWEIRKNEIDMDYNKLLQKYQVLCTVVYGIPLSIIGILLSTKMDVNNVFFATLTGTIIYVFLNKAKARIESELENLKRKVNKI
ncbi:MAG: hypothetical protein QXD43_00420 [Candidatus Aenigmatarchaeota archaeon]